MTDRELLEMAAVAGGLERELFSWSEEGECIKYPYRSPLTDCHLWNPLEDDGDALRLAVTVSKKMATGLRLLLPDSGTDWVACGDSFRESFGVQAYGADP